MKKIFATLSLAALALSSCIKENDSYKDLLPIQPGQYIYSYVVAQDRVAMQAANAGIRVAILAAEVAKQRAEGDEEVTVETVKYNNVLIYKTLFSSGTTIEEVEEGYMLTFNKADQMSDGFYLEGSVVVRTNGAPELTGGATWNVDMQPDFKLYSYSSYGGAESQINMSGGTTTIQDNQDGSYTIRVAHIVAGFEGNDAVSSDWSSGENGFLLRPEGDVTLAYSSCRGKNFEFEGKASGYSIYSNTYGSGPLSMEYSVSDAVYARTIYGVQIISGTQECEFSSPLDYDTSAYPAPDVRYVWDNGQYHVYYNGYIYPKD